MRALLSTLLLAAGCSAGELSSTSGDAAAGDGAAPVADGAAPATDGPAPALDGTDTDAARSAFDAAFGFELDAAPPVVAPDAAPPVDPDAAEPVDPPLVDEDAAVGPPPPPPPPECPFAPGAEPQKKAIFTDQYPAEDLDIEDELIRLFRAATPGSQIRIALFTWTRGRMVDALMSAAQRGVDVRVVLDESNQIEEPEGSGNWRYTAAVQRLLTELGRDRVTLCNARTPPDGGGCHGTGINHNKFFLFSELCDGSRNVVVQSSANLTNPQITQYNNAVVIRNDAALHAAYLGYWRDLDAERRDLSYYHSENGDTGTKAYFFPRASQGGDPDPDRDTIHNILADNVECGNNSEVLVMMAFWSQARGYLVEDLARLRGRGCDVRVIVSRDASTDALQRHLRDALPDNKIHLVDGVHSKYLLVKADYLGERKHLVWTGSHNYTGPALRENDETLLKIDDRAIFDAFRANWQRGWDNLR